MRAQWNPSRAECHEPHVIGLSSSGVDAFAWWVLPGGATPRWRTRLCGNAERIVRGADVAWSAAPN
jgi:hypothetical protein